MTARLPKGKCLLILICAVMVSGCGRPIDVNVGTEEPIQVNMKMDVHVYQHGKESEEDKVRRLDKEAVLQSRRNRMKEIQDLKNNRLVGEDHQGLLSIRNLPAGEYGLYVKKTVKAENQDREFLMKAESEERGTALGDVKKNQWRHWQRKSFPGEWIQVEGDEPGTYHWVQKTTAGDKEGEKKEE